MFRSNRIFPLPIDTPCQHRTPDHCADFPIKYQQTYNLYRVSQKKCCSCLSGLNSFSRMDNLDKILLFHHTIHLNHLCIKFQACLKSPFFIENYSCFSGTPCNCKCFSKTFLSIMKFRNSEMTPNDISTWMYYAVCKITSTKMFRHVTNIHRAKIISTFII